MRRRDLKAMLLCLVAAATFWWLHAMNQPYASTLEYPLEVRFDPSKFVQVGRVSTTLRVHITAQGWTLMRRKFGFGLRTITLSVDNPPKGGYVLGSSLFSEANAALGGSQVNDLPDDTIWLQIERIEERELTLAFDTKGLELAAPWYLSAAARFYPRKVVLRGPGSVLDSIGDTLEIHNPGPPLYRPWDRHPLALAEQLPALVSGEPDEVQVSLPMARYREVSVRLRPRVPAPGSEGEDWPTPVELVYKLPESSTAKFESADFLLQIDKADLDADSTYGIRLLRKPAEAFDIEWFPRRMPLPKRR